MTKSKQVGVAAKKAAANPFDDTKKVVDKPEKIADTDPVRWAIYRAGKYAGEVKAGTPTDAEEMGRKKFEIAEDVDVSLTRIDD